MAASRTACDRTLLQRILEHMTHSQPLEPAGFSSQRKLRLAYFVSHPIQYQAPLLRRIAGEEDIDLKVFFSSDISVRGYLDRGFGVSVKWDVPLLDGYNCEFLPTLRDAKTLGFSRPINYRIRRIIREQGFDALWVHGYSTLTSLQAILAASSMKIPVLLRAESTLNDRPRSRSTLAAKDVFFSILRKRVSAVLSIGEANEAYWRRYLGAEIPVFQFHYTVDNEFFQRECASASKTREQFRQSLGLDADRPVILFASKLQGRKRCGDLLEAYLQISKSGMRGRVPYLLIVGDGEERASLEERAKEAEVGDVRFLGFRNQTELPQFYDLCSVFVLASINEPWGLVINEVMNAGRAVIVTDEVGCQKNLVQDGVNGCVIKARDINGLADSLRMVLADEMTWKMMGAQSLRIIQNFSFDQNIAGLRLALQHVVPGFQAVFAK
jgi:glycosyltransferase involved in cell wall biosynthesis